MAVHPRYPNVFSPIRLGPVEIPNRFYFAPHGTALSIGSKPSADYVAYTVERVRGGCGLVVNSLPVHDRPSAFQATPYPRANVPAFRAMAEAVHEAGGKVFGEIWYWWGMYGRWQPLGPPAPALGASAIQYDYKGVTRSTHEMGVDEIRSMIGAHRQSAAHLAEAGYDGVMLHAAHGGLLEQFLSPYFNHRTDEYGGSVERRMRLLVECLSATREGVGDDLAVGMRFNCDELLTGGFDTRGARQILATVCGSGLVDYVDLDIGIEPNQLHLGMPSVLMEPHLFRPYVEAVRDAAGDIPVLSVLGRLTSVADGEDAIAAGVCDMVGAARALIAEPELVNNAFHANEERSRTCIACNWCTEAMPTDGAQGCSINPASFRERLWGVDTFVAAARRSKVVVVGGGPAGLEAARVCALRGHDVTLFEVKDALGGALAVWASVPGREWFQRAIEWWARELRRLGVDVRCGTAASADVVLAEQPDAVIVATGSRYSVGGRSGFRDLDIPGSDRDFVYRPEDVLVDGVRPTGTVVLLDAEGLDASVGVAEILAAAGAEVHQLAPGFLPASPRFMSTHQFQSVVTRLKTAGVNFSPSSYLSSIDDHEVTVFDTFTGTERTIDGVDAVVLATGRVPVSALGRELEGKIAQLFTIGDALAVRPFGTAAYEGQLFARYVGEPDAPTTVAEAYFRANPPEMMPQPAEALLSATASVAR